MPQILFISLAVLLRVLSNPVGNVFQKGLTARGYHPLQVNFYTYALLGLCCLLPALFISWPALSAPFWIYSALTGGAGALGNGFLVRALEKGDLSVLGPINAYKSVVGLVTGIFLLGEWPNVWGLAGVALIIWGSYFVLDSPEERFSWRLLQKKEIQYRIWALVLTAVEAVFIKKVILASSPLIAFFSWCWAGALGAFLLLYVYRVKGKKLSGVNAGDGHRLFFLLLCIGTMQLTTNYVLEHMPVGYALSLFQLSILVSVVLGHRIYGEGNIRRKLVGSLIMILGSVLIILLK